MPNPFPSPALQHDLQCKLLHFNSLFNFFPFRTTSEVTVSHIDNPAHFFIQHNHNWEQIETLSTRLNEFFQVRYLFMVMVILNGVRVRLFVSRQNS